MSCSQKIIRSWQGTPNSNRVNSMKLCPMKSVYVKNVFRQNYNVDITLHLEFTINDN